MHIDLRKRKEIDCEVIGMESYKEALLEQFKILAEINRSMSNGVYKSEQFVQNVKSMIEIYNAIFKVR